MLFVGVLFFYGWDTRKIDELGRVVLPSELRKKLGWGTGDSVSVIEKDGIVIFRPFEKCQEPKCVFCGVAESALKIDGSDICANCIEKIKTA